MDSPKSWLLPTILVLLCAFHQSVFNVDWVHAETSVVYRAEGAVEYTYIPGDRREPFQSMLAESGHSLVSRATKRDTLDAIKETWNLLGIVSGLKGKQAMLRNAKGQKYVVSAGDMLSGNKIRIVQLTDTTVTLKYLAHKNPPLPSGKSKMVSLTFVR